MSRTWFITGASRGFGRAWAEAALERGDRVAATARDLTKLADLADRHGDAVLPLELDVVDTDAAADAVRETHRHFGSLDIVVNNAGYGHGGFVEELTDAEARAQLDTNFFGPLAVTRAAIPLMRAQRSGHIIQVASIGGVMAFPGSGLYHASKWALEGLSDALAQEVEQFGIAVTIVEPGPFATDFYGTSGFASEPLPAYQPMRDAAAVQMDGFSLPSAADSAGAILALTDSSRPPRRLVLGSIGYDMVQSVHAARMTTWQDWEVLSRSADSN